ncbi:MAG: DDE-type integrase/transposase/recombinase [Candidatus Marinimicrobia bacterium]|nr:DDE-type integrase/transposase/recombinase [Candidatus Neomarinimicrobiota bacterium]
MIKSLVTKIKFSGLPEHSKTSLKQELERVIKGKLHFDKAINAIQRCVYEKFVMLKTALDFKPLYVENDRTQKKQAFSQSSDNTSRSTKKFKSDQQQATPKFADSRESKKNICTGCGWVMKQVAMSAKGKPTYHCKRLGVGCLGGNDPRRNTMTKTPWDQSDVGKEWGLHGYSALPKDTSVTLANAKEKLFEHASKKNDSSKYVNMTTNDAPNENQNDIFISTNTIPFLLPFAQVTRKRLRSGNQTSPSREGSVPTGKLLLDTGAIGSSVMSEEFFKYIRDNNIQHEVRAVDSPLIAATGNNTISNKEIFLTIRLNVEDNSIKRPLNLLIKALVAPIQVDLIIDKDTIKEYNLVKYFPSHFAEGELLQNITQLPPLSTEEASIKATDEEAIVVIPTTSHINIIRQKPTTLMNVWVSKFRHSANVHHHNWVQNQKAIAFQTKSTQQSLYEREDKPKSYLYTLLTKPLKESSSNQTNYLFNINSNFSQKPAFEREGNLTEIPDNKLESIPAELISDVHSENDHKKVHINGAPYVKSVLCEFVQEFYDIFNSSVQSIPAKLAAFKLKIDATKWELPRNQLRVRRLDREREIELVKLIKILLDANIIEACDAEYYSHAFLVPKPNGKWRLVLDFKNLNDATHNHYIWPLPDIKEMLQRVGDSRPKFFAVFDLTSGYYQAEIDEDSREFTAFLTRQGVYRWLRLPMGLKGACSYFQKSLVTQVLRGLMHDGVELYLDDCMVHAPTLDIYLKRLREVFLRFRESKITLNPSKCYLGLPQVEFVGHTINDKGLHFTRDKLDSVLNFPRPETKRHIKSFLGLANYFRDHIRNHSIRAQPLQDLVDKYEAKQARHRVQWTPEAIAAFEDLRSAIDQCPMLWFMDDTSPIFLRTDASDYGIGAYLYQLVPQEDGEAKEIPIGFISKSIGSKHQSWDTPMKEGFGIFYALKKWEYLLRDRQFTIQTDHKNLTRLRQDHDSNKMVKRWFMCYQEYDVLDWQYVKGEDNFVPDRFSRLCKQEEDVHPAVHLFQLTGFEVPEEHWNTIARFHNSGIPTQIDGKARVVGGHGGVARTLQQLDEAGHQWKHRTKHVRRFIRMCPCCQKMDQLRRTIHSYPFTLSTYGLWHTVSVDYIERLVPDQYGNNMIIVIIDNFSRFVDLYPTNSTNAEGAADALLAFCGRYVTPTHFTTDSGANFKSKLIAGLLERLGSDHFLTTAYSKEMNGLVERANKEILRHLRNIIFDHRIAARWSKYTPIVQRIVNTVKNSSTGVAPADIVFPSGYQLDRSVLTEASSIHLSSYIEDLQQAQAKIIAIAESNLRKKDNKHMDNYSKERTVFEEGSYVLVEPRQNALRRGPASKMLPFLEGPMLVKEHNALGIYKLQDIVTQGISKHHVKTLRPFLHDERTMTPLQVAVTDTLDEFVAERVVRMRGNTRRSRKDLSFLIHWAGSDDSDDTWEPWENCKDSHAVQNFLRDHKEARVRRLAKPIPALPDDLVEEEDI